MRTTTLARRACRNALVFGLVLLAVACSSSSSTSGSAASTGSPSPSASASPASVSAAVCEDVAALRGSLQALTGIRPGVGTTDQLRTAAQNVKSNLSSLSGSAGALWSGQISNLGSALTTLQSAIGTLAAQRNASSVSGVVTAIGGVSTAARQLLDVVSLSCPSPSESPSSGAS